MPRTIVFTATRTVTPRGVAIMRDVCENVQLVHRFVSGCADGGDTAVALFCLAMWQRSEHHICIPDYHHNEILAAYMKVREETMTAGVIIHRTNLPPLKRNEYMLDLFRDEAEVIAFPSTSNEQMRGSGTWACIREARKRTMKIRVFPLNGDEPWTEI